MNEMWKCEKEQERLFACCEYFCCFIFCFCFLKLVIKIIMKTVKWRRLGSHKKFQKLFFGRNKYFLITYHWLCLISIHNVSLRLYLFSRIASGSYCSKQQWRWNFPYCHASVSIFVQWIETIRSKVHFGQQISVLNRDFNVHTVLLFYHVMQI